MQDKTQIVSILFSDIENYSQIQDDHLILVIEKFNDEIKNNILNENNHFFHNTWGDAFFICSFDPVDMANIALDMRDKFKNTNWVRLGFSKNLSVRIGIHTEKVNISYEGNLIKNVSGYHVTSTARIEPIVEPNHIYCSEFFYKHLVKEKNINFGFISLGSKKLAKEFGEEPLYELVRDYELDKSNISAQTTTFKFPKIKIKKNISQKELNDLLKQTFDFIQSYFREASNHLEKQNPEIEISFTKSDLEFNVELYLSGEYKIQCKIWYGDEYGTKQIFYSEGKTFGGQKSYNECIYIEYDGFDISFRPMMGFAFGAINTEILSKPEEVAEYLWLRFTQSLT